MVPPPSSPLLHPIAPAPIFFFCVLLAAVEKSAENWAGVASQHHVGLILPCGKTKVAGFCRITDFQGWGDIFKTVMTS